MERVTPYLKILYQQVRRAMRISEETVHVVLESKNRLERPDGNPAPFPKVTTYEPKSHVNICNNRNSVIIA